MAYTHPLDIDPRQSLLRSISPPFSWGPHTYTNDLPGASASLTSVRGPDVSHFSYITFSPPKYMIYNYLAWTSRSMLQHL